MLCRAKQGLSAPPPLWLDETIVWENIWKTRDKWTDKELLTSLDYVNGYRVAEGKPAIKIEELESYLKQRK